MSADIIRLNAARPLIDECDDGCPECLMRMAGLEGTISDPRQGELLMFRSLARHPPTPPWLADAEGHTGSKSFATGN